MLRLLSRLICALPLRAALALGRFLGGIWYYGLRIRRGVVRRNLDLAFGNELSPAEKSRVSREVFLNMGMYLIEDLRLPLLNHGNVRQLVRRVNEERYFAARELGRGVIVLCCHITSWDLMAVSQAFYGERLTVPVRVVKNRSIQRFIQRLRESSGWMLVPPSGCFDQLRDALGRREVVALILDQHMSSTRGVIVDFFGHPVSCTPGCAVLALRTGAPILPAIMLRQPDGTHLLHIEPSLDFARPFDNDDDNILYNTQRYTAIIERWVRAHPGSWLWLHRRWKAMENPKFAPAIAAWQETKRRWAAQGVALPSG